MPGVDDRMLVRSPSLSWRTLPIGVYVHDHAAGASYVLDPVGSTIFLNSATPSSPELLLASVPGTTRPEEVLESLVQTGVLRTPGDRPVRAQSEHSSGDSLIDTLVASNAVRLAIPYSVGLEWLEHRKSRPRHLALVGSEAGDLTTGDWVRILEDLVRLGTVTISVTGRDALVRGDSLFLLRHARQLGFAVNLFCDASNIREDLAPDLAALYLESVWITLRGADAETHDGLADDTGSFHRTIRFIRALTDAGQPVRINGFPPTASPSLRLAMRNLARELDCQLVSDPMLLQGFDERALACTTGPSTSNYQDVFARPSIFVMPDGLLRPCRAFDPLARTVPEESIADIWQTSTMLRQLAKVPSHSRAGCRDCLMRGACFS